jgi:ubiquinone/menaquinone biosynthesis C-methylase UbiE
MIIEVGLPAELVNSNGKIIKCYNGGSSNIDISTVQSFGDEWTKFNKFSDEEIGKIGDSYFDIVTTEMLGKDKLAIDFGCGSGRWTKYVHDKVNSVAAVDPSDAIYSAARLLQNADNVQLYKASIDHLPFSDNYFDFGFSLGVLHHIPDTQQAMNDCIRKIKSDGYFLVYLYYSLDNRGIIFKTLFKISDLFRRVISKFSGGVKRFVCDMLAIFFYMPFVLLSRLLKKLGVKKKYRSKIPLHVYENTSFFIIRNDALDRFGTPLEQRFSRKEIIDMMQKAGLKEIVVSQKMPYWHAVGKKK